MEEKIKNDEVYKLYGKFLVNFEHVSHVMRTAISVVIFPNESSKQVRQNEILLEGLTADQIRGKFLALIGEEFDSSTTVFKLAKVVSDIFRNTVAIRNSFAHGTAFIGESVLMKEAQDGLLLLRHPKLKKEGLDLNFKKYEIKALDHGIQLFERMKYAVAVVSVSMINKTSKKIYADGYSPDEHHQGLGAELLRLEKKLTVMLDK